MEDQDPWPVVIVGEVTSPSGARARWPASGRSRRWVRVGVARGGRGRGGEVGHRGRPGHDLVGAPRPPPAAARSRSPGRVGPAREQRDEGVAGVLVTAAHLVRREGEVLGGGDEVVLDALAASRCTRRARRRRRWRTPGRRGAAEGGGRRARRAPATPGVRGLAPVGLVVLGEGRQHRRVRHGRRGRSVVQGQSHDVSSLRRGERVVLRGTPVVPAPGRRVPARGVAVVALARAGAVVRWVSPTCWCCAAPRRGSPPWSVITAWRTSSRSMRHSSICLSQSRWACEYAWRAEPSHCST